MRAKITALGTYVPPRVMTNADFERIVETSDEWIVSRTGIRERHVVDNGVATSDLAVEAAKRALAERGIDGNEIEAIVVATVTPDMLFPSTACLVQHKLGIKKVWGFDLSAACSAFVYALQTGAQFVGTGAHKKVLVIGLARTGVATSLFCARHEAIVTAVDTRPESELAEIAAKLRAAEVSLQLGGYTEKILNGQDLVIPSPGVPADSAILKAARAITFPSGARSNLPTAFSTAASLASLAPTEKPQPLLSSNTF